MGLRGARVCHHCFAVARPLLIYKFLQSIFRHGIGGLMVSAWLGEVYFEMCLHTASVWIECTLASTVLITTMPEISRLSYYIHAAGKAEGRGKWKPPTFSYLFEETYFGKSGRDMLFSSLCIWVRQGYRLSCKFLETKMQICASINWSRKERFGDTNVSLRKCHVLTAHNLLKAMAF